MPEEKVFEAAKKIYGLYGSFFKTVAREVGMEKALALHLLAHEEQGSKSGRMLEEKMGGGEIDPQKLGSVLRKSKINIGIESTLDKANASSTLFKNYLCPMYDGYRMEGWTIKPQRHNANRVPCRRTKQMLRIPKLAADLRRLSWRN